MDEDELSVPVGPQRPKKKKKSLTPQKRSIKDMTNPDTSVSTGSPPKKKSKKNFDHQFSSILSNIPSQPLYEWSYSHYGEISHLLINQESEFIVSISEEGYMKIWKRSFENIEFVKVFRVSKNPVVSASLSHDGKILSILMDRETNPGDKNSSKFYVKVFDILNVVLTNIIEVKFVPFLIRMFKDPEDRSYKMIITEKNSNNLYIYSCLKGEDIKKSGTTQSSLEKPKKFEKKISEIHKNNSIITLEYNHVFEYFVSIDNRGIIEYWNTQNFQFNANDGFTFRFKSETNLFELAMCNTRAMSLAFNKDGTEFVVVGLDRFIRVFDFFSGNILKKIDESISRMKVVQQSNSDKYALHGLDFGKRIEIEKQIDKSPSAPPSNAIFDESGIFLIYPTSIGIKVVNLITNKVVRLLGKHEHNYRFLNISMFQGKAKIDRSKLAELKNFKRKYSVISGSGTLSFDMEFDPIIFCCAFKKNRFFMFTNRLFDESYIKEGVSRNVIDDSDYELQMIENSKSDVTERKKNLPKAAVIHTHFGDVKVKLFPDQCPLTVENFVGHSRNGYYDGLIFHRVIKNFMIQTGDPKGDGTGGRSIWGGNFKDEFNPGLRHSEPFKLSMANTGAKNSNGSQFFITTTVADWLDDKHTLFGEVTNGSDVVKKIENVKVSKYDKPFEDVKIINITVTENVE